MFFAFNCAIISYHANAYSGTNNPEIDYPNILSSIHNAITATVSDWRQADAKLQTQLSDQERDIVKQEVGRLKREFESLVNSLYKYRHDQLLNKQ